MRPDEAFGLIFMWDNVVANTRELQRAAWQAVAQAEGLPFPEMERPQLYELRPERAATDVSPAARSWAGLGWCDAACRGGGPAAGRQKTLLAGRQAGLRGVRCATPPTQTLLIVVCAPLFESAGADVDKGLEAGPGAGVAGGL